MAWKIAAEPQGSNDGGKNEGGMVIFLTPGGQYGNREEIGRVAFERANSLNPDVSYEDQLDIEIGKAKKSIEVLEELAAGAGELR